MRLPSICIGDEYLVHFETDGNIISVLKHFPGETELRPYPFMCLGGRERLRIYRHIIKACRELNIPVKVKERLESETEVNDESSTS